MSVTCSKCNTRLFVVGSGEWECPVCDWLPAYVACAHLGIKFTELEERVQALVKALKGKLPMDAAGGCVWCGLGSIPKNFIHPDKDFVWGGDQNCLSHPTYATALAALAPFSGRRPAVALTPKQEEIRQCLAKLVAPRTTWLAADLLQLYLNDVPTLLADLEAAERRLADLKQGIREIEHDAWQLREYVQCDRPACRHVGPTDPEVIQAIRSRAAALLAPPPAKPEGGE